MREHFLKLPLKLKLLIPAFAIMAFTVLGVSMLSPKKVTGRAVTENVTVYAEQSAGVYETKVVGLKDWKDESGTNWDQIIHNHGVDGWEYKGMVGDFQIYQRRVKP